MDVSLPLCVKDCFCQGTCMCVSIFVFLVLKNESMLVHYSSLWLYTTIYFSTNSEQRWKRLFCFSFWKSSLAQTGGLNGSFQQRKGRRLLSEQVQVWSNWESRTNGHLASQPLLETSATEITAGFLYFKSNFFRWSQPPPPFSNSLIFLCARLNCDPSDSRLR